MLHFKSNQISGTILCIFLSTFIELVTWNLYIGTTSTLVQINLSRFNHNMKSNLLHYLLKILKIYCLIFSMIIQVRKRWKERLPLSRLATLIAYQNLNNCCYGAYISGVPVSFSSYYKGGLQTSSFYITMFISFARYDFNWWYVIINHN